MKVSFFKYHQIWTYTVFTAAVSAISYVKSINLYICIYYIIHSSCTICLYTTMCSVAGFVIMHAAELLQLFHHALPKPASCRASHVAPGHCTEKFVFVYFVHLFSIVWLWQVHWCMVSFVLPPFPPGWTHQSFTSAAVAKFDNIPTAPGLSSLSDNFLRPDPSRTASSQMISGLSSASTPLEKETTFPVGFNLLLSVNSDVNTRVMCFYKEIKDQSNLD